MRRIVGGKVVDGNVTPPDPNKRGVRSVFLQVAIVLGRKPSSNLTNPFGLGCGDRSVGNTTSRPPHVKDTGMP
jgi:hypothetical protein